ncbi:LOW QUALITY PROTEIN: hypothetical protein NC652_010617 [Populus alba x Populus x berolinensis]|nr:LOW QUALITY PROTEIN: hypothetical protein NC652_010617 [Populus alba x Populus x berolinensis]
MVHSQGSFNNPPLTILKLTLPTKTTKPHNKKPCVAAAVMMIASRLSLRPAFCFPLRNPLYHRGVRVDCWYHQLSLQFDSLKLVLTCICPCCLCVTIIVEFALGLIKAPILFDFFFGHGNMMPVFSGPS